jgi:glycosyltransferase involved in cell wall biosynthesis
MPEFYSSTDVLVAPSIWPESFGLITREAQQAGVWVVAANAGGLAEDVKEGIDGNVFEAGSVAALVRILKQIDRDPRCYLEPDFDNRKHAPRTVAQQVNELTAIYRKILQLPS